MRLFFTEVKLGKKARSFFICFVIVVLFCGALFFLGWTQFRVKNDTVGILVSKTGGVNKQVIESGAFSWHWEFLVPTNAQLLLFNTKPVLIERTVSGELPSGSLYARLYTDSPDFSYNFDFSLSAAVSGDAILSLVQKNSISGQNSLVSYLENAADYFIGFAVRKLLSLPEDSVILPEAIDFDSVFKDIDISEKYPGVTIDTVSVRNIRIPDYALYQKARAAAAQFQQIPEKKPDAPVLQDSKKDSEAESSAGQDSGSRKSDDEKALELLNELQQILSGKTQ